jgi:hypothetical protein
MDRGYRTVRPAEGRPAIVTGCAGISDCGRAVSRSIFANAIELHCTSTVTRFDSRVKYGARQRRHASCPGNARRPGCAGLTAEQSRCYTGSGLPSLEDPLQ